METAHTALPWFATSTQLGVHTYIEARIGGGMVQEIASCGPTEGEEGSEGNAEFIVRACNAHDDLVYALRTMILAVNKESKERFPGHHEAYLNTVAIPRAHAALAKAVEK